MARVILEVSVNLDPVPGAFHTAASAASSVHLILHDRIGQYHPTVTIKEVQD
jgi:hypothetical protein